MTSVRNWAIGIVLVIVLFAAVAIIATGLLDNPSGADGQDVATPIATEAISPISELEPVEGTSEDIAVPLQTEGTIP